jgi:formate hydrogenlyase subunit 3/multisubunit Na+/H+ antiporter MnhD subunit
MQVEQRDRIKVSLMKKKNIFLLILLIVTVSSFLVFAFWQMEVISTSENQEGHLIIGPGLELDNVITLIASIMAMVLFGLTFLSYKRDGRKRFLYVSIAFLLFAIRGLLLTLDIFYPQKAGWVDLFAAVLDFAILLSFFFGILKK